VNLQKKNNTTRKQDLHFHEWIRTKAGKLIKYFGIILINKYIIYSNLITNYEKNFLNKCCGSNEELYTVEQKC
jgi:hypothetical protein